MKQSSPLIVAVGTQHQLLLLQLQLDPVVPRERWTVRDQLVRLTEQLASSVHLAIQLTQTSSLQQIVGLVFGF